MVDYAANLRVGLGLGDAALLSAAIIGDAETAAAVVADAAVIAAATLIETAAIAAATSVSLLKAANLSDMASIPAARTNLGLGAAALLAVGTTAGTVAAGDDSRITGAAQKASNLSDLTSAPTARTNLGLGGAAVLNVGTTTGTVAAGDDSRIVAALTSSTAFKLLARRTTASAAIANTETMVINGTVLANVLTVGSIIRLTAVGVMINTTGASTSTYRIRIGPTTLTGVIAASTAFVNVTVARTNVIVKIVADVLVRAVGASATALGQIIPLYGSCGSVFPVGLTVAPTFNSTVNNLVEFTFISGATTTTATFHSATLELVT